MMSDIFSREVPTLLLTTFNGGYLEPRSFSQSESGSCFVQTTSIGINGLTCHAAGCHVPNASLKSFGSVLRVADGGRVILVTRKKQSAKLFVFVMRLPIDSAARLLPLDTNVSNGTTSRTSAFARTMVSWKVDSAPLKLESTAILSNGDGMLVYDATRNVITHWSMFTLPQDPVLGAHPMDAYATHPSTYILRMLESDDAAEEDENNTTAENKKRGRKNKQTKKDCESDEDQAFVSSSALSKLPAHVRSLVWSTSMSRPVTDAKADVEADADADVEADTDADKADQDARLRTAPSSLIKWRSRRLAAAALATKTATQKVTQTATHTIRVIRKDGEKDRDGDDDDEDKDDDDEDDDGKNVKNGKDGKDEWQPRRQSHRLYRSRQVLRGKGSKGGWGKQTGGKDMRTATRMTKRRRFHSPSSPPSSESPLTLSSSPLTSPSSKTPSFQLFPFPSSLFSPPLSLVNDDDNNNNNFNFYSVGGAVAGDVSFVPRFALGALPPAFPPAFPVSSSPVFSRGIFHELPRELPRVWHPTARNANRRAQHRMWFDGAATNAAAFKSQISQKPLSASVTGIPLRGVEEKEEKADRNRALDLALARTREQERERERERRDMKKQCVCSSCIASRLARLHDSDEDNEKEKDNEDEEEEDGLTLEDTSRLEKLLACI